jgi:hypothetical protein
MGVSFKSGKWTSEAIDVKRAYPTELPAGRQAKWADALKLRATKKTDKKETGLTGLTG